MYGCDALTVRLHNWVFYDIKTNCLQKLYVAFWLTCDWRRVTFRPVLIRGRRKWRLQRSWWSFAKVRFLAPEASCWSPRWTGPGLGADPPPPPFPCQYRLAPPPHCPLRQFLLIRLKNQLLVCNFFLDKNKESYPKIWLRVLWLFACHIFCHEDAANVASEGRQTQIYI